VDFSRRGFFMIMNQKKLALLLIAETFKTLQILDKMNLINKDNEEFNTETTSITKMFQISCKKNCISIKYDANSVGHTYCVCIKYYYKKYNKSKDEDNEDVVCVVTSPFVHT